MGRLLYTLVIVLIAGSPLAAHAQACHTRSDYDVTLGDTALQFERKTAPAQLIEMRKGALSIDHKALGLGGDDRRRVAAIEAKVRELVPRIKTIGQRSVDLMVAAIREEAARASPASAANPEVNARVDARAREFKRRIIASKTSKEWHPDALGAYMTTMLGDVAPLITGDLTQKAVDLTMKGDFGGVIALKDQALALRESLERRIRSLLQELQPDIDKLCPALRELDRLESGIGAAHIDLIQVTS